MRHHVDTVCQWAGLTPDPDRIERAVENIAPGLHRYREGALPAVCRNIYDRSSARRVLDMPSRHDGPDAWPKLLRFREWFHG